MSIQIINLVFLVAIINGVYSGVNIDLPKLPTEPKKEYPNTKAIMEYRIGVVSDLETGSRVPGGGNEWYTYFKKGYLSYDPNTAEVSVKWDSGEERGDMYYTKHANDENRGFELSELVTFNGNLLAADDQTGLLYAYHKGFFKSWKVVSTNSKAVPMEWATVKGEYLYVGPNGQDDQKSVTRLDAEGNMKSFDWTENFKLLKNKLDIKESGTVIHEACIYSATHKKFFLSPKIVSKDADATKSDANQSKWLLPITITEDDKPGAPETPIVIRELEKHPDRGISSFKFVPNTGDKIIVALETSEENNESYITAFTIEGKMILNSTKVADIKFEGLEFL